MKNSTLARCHNLFYILFDYIRFLRITKTLIIVIFLIMIKQPKVTMFEKIKAKLRLVNRFIKMLKSILNSFNMSRKLYHHFD